MGLEPGNACVYGRAFHETEQTLPMLAAQETAEYHLRFRILEGEDTIRNLENHRLLKKGEWDAMKRSEINAVIRKFEALLDKYSFALPPFLSWTPEEWQTKGHEYDEIRDNMLGWDVTDYGMGQFDTLGLALITIRNGNVHNQSIRNAMRRKL